MTNKKLQKTDYIFLSTLSIIGSLILLYSSNSCFFWDTISIVSRQAHFLFSNHLSSYLYPVNFDNGDPQLLQSYIALCWLIFGKSILVAHLSMIPFLIGIIYFVLRTTKKLFENNTAYITTFLILIEPSIISQGIIMSQDILVILFSLIVLNGILEKKSTLISFGLLFLTLVSRRGIIISAGFILSISIIDLFIEKKKINWLLIKKYIRLFTPPTLSLLIYFLIRYYYFGWFFSHPESPWYSSSSFATFFKFIKNGLTIGRAFLDYGKFIWWVILAIIIVRFGIKQAIDKYTNKLWIIFFSILIIILPATLLINNDFGGRYFIPHYIIISLIILKIIHQSFSPKIKNILFGLIFISIISGNFWVYPEKVSQSWDCSLVHLPYYKLREDVKMYFEKHEVNFSDVGFGYPNTAKLKFLEVNNDQRKFSNIEPGENKFIVYSNIQNLDNKTIYKIKNEYILIQSFKQKGIFMDIYRAKGLKKK